MNGTGTPAWRVWASGGHYRALILSVLAGVLGAVLWALGASTAAVILVGGYAILYAGVIALRMIRQLLRGTAGVDLLAVIAIVATVLVGEVVASLIVVVMLSTGGALEDFAERRARRDLTLLLSKEPKTAHVREAHTGALVIKDVNEVAVGDRVLVLSGEVVPVDGQIVSEEAVFDVSSVTGESMPVELTRGEMVLSGFVNGSASVELIATATARESQLQTIVELVRRAAGSKAPVVRLADRFAVPFTLVSLAIGVAAWIISGDATRFAEVLVLATPCPLILAAPVAFMGGMSRAAREGAVVKGGAVLETLARVRAIVFDKTGTLTEGRPSVVRILPHGDLSRPDLLRAAASAEASSSHVLAASILAAATSQGLSLAPVTRSVERQARGIDAEIEGRHVQVGTRRFVEEMCGAVPEVTIQGGEAAVYVGLDGRYAGCIVVSDPLRREAAGTTRVLRGMGIERLMMLTGDAESTAAHVAAELGIREYRAGCLPEDKVSELTALRPRPVAMVGDGVNDAPVLAAADVGIAMAARGASAASETADAVILREDLSLVPRLVTISRRTVTIALQSIGIGIALSLALMIVAAFGVIPAVVGATLQEVVDLATILNALRAVRRDRPLARTPAPAQRIDAK